MDAVEPLADDADEPLPAGADDGVLPAGCVLPPVCVDGSPFPAGFVCEELCDAACDALAPPGGFGALAFEDPLVGGGFVGAEPLACALALFCRMSAKLGAGALLADALLGGALGAL